MPNGKKIWVNTLPISSSFKEHFEKDGNRRIMFTGPFGTGKSTFLDSYFSENNDVVYLRLSPVNYSVGHNEDIFEWIKYDLLIELINRYGSDLNLEREEVPFLFALQMHLASSANLISVGATLADHSILLNLFGISEKIGKSVGPILQIAKTAITKIKKKQRNFIIDEGEQLMGYLKEIEASSLSVHENGNISGLILSLLKRLKINKKKLNSVLVIDDLDRLDPEHTFRLFNIFSSHYDANDQNKFGFDKVIFVCDVDNIRNIFHHRYGHQVDFSGYIDKFFTYSPFRFDNQVYVKQILYEVYRWIHFDESFPFGKYIIDSNTPFYMVLEWLTEAFIEARELNLRTLLLFPNITVKHKRFNLPSVNSEFYNSSYPLLILLEILSACFPSIDIFQEKLSRLKNIYWNEHRKGKEKNNNGVEAKKRYLIQFCLPFIIDEQRGFNQVSMAGAHQTPKLNHDFDNAVIQYKYVAAEDGVMYKPNLIRVASKNNLEETGNINVFALFYETFVSCRNRGIFPLNE